MTQEIEYHIRPNISRLEKYRTEIKQMRRRNWPNAKIAQWLLDYKNLKISGESVRKFCHAHDIKKSENISVPTLPPIRQHRNPQKQQRPVFEYKDDGPLDVKI